MGNGSASNAFEDGVMYHLRNCLCLVISRARVVTFHFGRYYCCMRVHFITASYDFFPVRIILDWG